MIRPDEDERAARIGGARANPVLIDEEDGIIAGHGRVLAAHLLCLDEVPCIVLAHLTPAQGRTYVEEHGKPVAFYSDKHGIFG